MKVNISNIIVSINKNQEKEIYKELEKNGISRENIENLKYLKKSIDSRKKNDIKFIYTLEINLKKNINYKKGWPIGQPLNFFSYFFCLPYYIIIFIIL